MDAITARIAKNITPTIDDFHEEVLVDDDQEYTIRFLSERCDGQRFWGHCTVHMDNGEPDGYTTTIDDDSPKPDETEEQRILDATEERRYFRRLQEQA